MSIEYETLVLENFGPYASTQQLTFAAPHTGHPVTLVDGKNGFGKTSILNSFHWLLYGEPDLEARARLINRTATHEGATRMRVELHFKRGGESHRIVRTLSAPAGVTKEFFDERLSYLINGQPQANPTARIRELLPEQASQFFLFDGAKISRYANLENEKAVREAIEMVLGLPAYERAAQHLQQLRERWEKAARKEQHDDEHAKAKIDKLAQKEAERDSLKEAIANSQKLMSELEAKKEQIMSNLQRFASQRDRITTLKLRQSEHQRHKERLSELRVEQARSLRRYAHLHVLPMVESALATRAKQLAELSAKREQTDRRRFALEFVHSIQSAQSSLGADTIRQLEALVKRLYPEQTADPTLELLPRLQVEVGELTEKVRAIKALPSPQVVRQKYREERALVARYETEINELRKGLGEVNEEEVLSLNQELELTNQQIGTIHARIDDDNRRLADSQKACDSLAREISHLSTGGKAKTLHAQADLARKLAIAFETVLNRARNQKRANIEQHASEQFKKFTRKPEVYAKLRINEDYTLAVIDNKGIEHRRDLISAGEKQLVALSFIVGLMKSTHKVAPIIIDTPFGHLDLLHREKVMKHLPEIGQQLMFLVTDADVPTDKEHLIKPHVGRKYVIQYDQTRQTSHLAEVKV